MYILGISAYHPDCSACLIKDGKLLGAVEEERFRRVKHWAGFPSESIRYCLQSAGISLDDIDHIAVGRDTRAHLARKFTFLLSEPRAFVKLKDRLRNKKRIVNIPSALSKLFNISEDKVKTRIHYVEHHKAHMASAYLVSGFEESAILSLDGFGDFVSCMSGIGKGNSMKRLGAVFYPHSLGLFYTAITQYLGFTKYGDEYKVMGLAPYGKPVYKDEFDEIIKYRGKGYFRMNLSFFRHHLESMDMTWEKGEPEMKNLFSRKLVKMLGKERLYGEPINKHHHDIAATLQAKTEEIIFSILNHLYKLTKSKNICLAGGVAMNSVANGKIFDHTPFKKIYVQAAAGDAGTSLGAAYHVYNSLLKEKREFVMNTASWGPGFDEKDISGVLEKYKTKLLGCKITRLSDEYLICKKTAEYIANGNIVGWFQGRMEWGPRALGNRSILADPRNPKMKDILNARIKKRESFRPFAPSILEEKTGEYFEIDYPDPFMTKVYPIKKDKQKLIPAVTHVDGTGRLQTVSRRDNPLYYRLIKEFEKITDVPVILNTSFNENEPIVCKPKEAIECFLRTKMDVLILGNFVISKK